MLQCRATWPLERLETMGLESFRRVLALSPHTDDVEIGCGATIARMTAAGVAVRSVAFSAAEESVPEGLPADVLRHEFVRAQAELGIEPDACEVLDFKVRYFPRDRQDLLEVLVKLSRTYQPDLVLVPSSNDTHQDHRAVAEEAYRAFKRTSIWAYEVPWNQPVSHLNGFVAVDESNLQRKLAAVAAYESQRHRSYVSPEFVRSLAVVRGSQMGVPLAEGFEIVRSMHR